VRAAAAESLPQLLECVKAKGTIATAPRYRYYHVLPTGPAAVERMWTFISSKLLEAIGIEPDPDILAVMMDSLCKVNSNHRTMAGDYNITV